MNSFHTRRLFLATVSAELNLRYSTPVVKHSRRTRRGTKGGRRVFRPIRTIVNCGRDVIRNHTESVNHCNLIDLITSENLTSSSIINSIQLAATNRSTNKKLNLKPKLRYLSSFQRTGCNNSSRDVSLFSLNCRSVKNKALSVCDFILSNKVDIFALTETWLGSSVDKSMISELKPDGYSIHHVSGNPNEVVV